MNKTATTLFLAALALPVLAWAQFDVELASYKGKLYATSATGPWNKKTLSVSESTDGVRWAANATFDPPKEEKSGSYGTPRFSINPNGRLLLSCESHPLIVWETADGRDWSLRQDLVSEYAPHTALVWHKGDVYFFRSCISCGCSGRVYLCRRSNGVFKRHSRLMKPNYEGPYEGDFGHCALLSIGDKLVCVTNSGSSTRLGIAHAPFKDWTWSKLVPAIKKPNLLQLPGERILVSGEHEGKHSLFQLNLTTNGLELLRTIPTNVSKPSRVGMTLHKDDLWVGYGIKSEDGYQVRAERIDLDNARPTIRKGSLSALVKEILAQPAPKEDNSPTGAGALANAGRLSKEVLRRRDLIAVTLTSIEFDEIEAVDVQRRIMALGPRTRELVAPILCRQLMSPESLQRQRARDALCYLVEIPQSAVPILLEAAQSSSRETRELALQVLCLCGPPPKSAEAILRACMRDYEQPSRAYAAACLLSLNENDMAARKAVANFLSHDAGWQHRIRKDYSVAEGKRVMRVRFGPQDSLNTLLTGREEIVWQLVIDCLHDQATSRQDKLSILRFLQPYDQMHRDAFPSNSLCDFAVSVPQSDSQLLEEALKALRSQGGFDAAKLEPIVERDLTGTDKSLLVETLGRANVNPQNAIRILRRFDNDTDRAIRESALEALARLGEVDDRLTARYARRLRTGDADTRRITASRAKRFTRHSSELLSELMDLLGDDATIKMQILTDYVCESGVPPLVAMGKPAVPSLIDGLKSVDADVRYHSAEALGRIGAKEAIRPLIELLNDEKSELEFGGKAKERSEIQVSALKALAKLGPETGDHVEHYAKFLDYPWSREAAVMAIGDAGRAGVRFVPRLEELQASNPSKSERRELKLAIARLSMQEPSRLNGLRRVLRTAAGTATLEVDREIMRIAMQTIRDLGNDAERLLPELRYLVDQHEMVDFEYRAYAVAVLSQVDSENPRWRSLLRQWTTAHFNNDPNRDLNRRVRSLLQQSTSN